jgi:hypothetical protein
LPDAAAHTGCPVAFVSVKIRWPAGATGGVLVAGRVEGARDAVAVGLPDDDATEDGTAPSGDGDHTAATGAGRSVRLSANHAAAPTSTTATAAVVNAYRRFTDIVIV